MLGPFLIWEAGRSWHVDPGMNEGPDSAQRASEVRCGCCDRVVRFEDAIECACCRRLACLACLRRYGHFMQVCEDCRLAEW